MSLKFFCSLLVTPISCRWTIYHNRWPSANLFFDPLVNSNTREDPGRGVSRSGPTRRTRPSGRCWSKSGSPPRSTTTSWRTSTSSPAPVRLTRSSLQRRSQLARESTRGPTNLRWPRSASARRSARWGRGEWNHRTSSPRHRVDLSHLGLTRRVTYEFVGVFKVCLHVTQDNSHLDKHHF